MRNLEKVLQFQHLKERLAANDFDEDT